MGGKGKENHMERNVKSLVNKWNGRGYEEEGV